MTGLSKLMPLLITVAAAVAATAAAAAAAAATAAAAANRGAGELTGSCLFMQKTSPRRGFSRKKGSHPRLQPRFPVDWIKLI